MKRRIYIAIAVFSFLLGLGGLNVYRKINWREPSDGIFWKKREGILRAERIDLNSPGYLAGIKKGDILYSINNNLVKSKIDVEKNLWLAWSSDQRLTYQINRQGELIFPSFYPVSRGPKVTDICLVFIGLTSITIGLFVLLNSKKSFSLPYIFFYLLCLIFYSISIFSPCGKLDTLDTLFYWLDKVSFLTFPPLLLHFFLIFPKRMSFFRKKKLSIFSIYLPAAAFLLFKVIIHLPLLEKIEEGTILDLYNLTGKLELTHFTLYSLAVLGIAFSSSLIPDDLLIKKQRKWIVYGLSFGMIPFIIFYIIPFLLDYVPSKAAELTVLLLALIPLTFSYSITRYRLMDLEVLLKKAVTLISSFIIIGVVYFIVSSRTKIFSEYRLNAIILGVLAILLGATLFSPLKALSQSLLDRAIYRRSYIYRKTLLSISKELSRERNLGKLSQSLLDLIANALSLNSIALLLPEDEKRSSFSILKARGKLNFSGKSITLDERIMQILKEKDFISLYSLKDRKGLQKKFEELANYGLYHYLPLKVEDKLIGCLGMGKKVNNTFLSSEDWELLTTISSPMALALENAYLYEQANMRAMELERLKDYSENIIESLTIGVAVLDSQGRIIGWNRILEGFFGKKKQEVLEKSLQEVLGEKNFSAIFPSDTQQGFRLLSEISLELPSNEKRLFDIAKTPLLDNRMNPYGTVIVFEDVTEKIRLQQQVLTSEKLASIGLLSAGVAHEINTPLTGISSYVQILQKRPPDSKHAQILEKIEIQTERIARIIKNLLNFARNPSDTSFYRVDLKQVLEEIVALIEYKLKTMNINLVLELSPVKPIYAQGERLQQVFINIILNAIDAMPEGGILKIILFEKENEVIIKIEDTGTGIEEQHLPHIFDPFFTTKGIGKGTGLGLSISYAIIKEHEGHIAVESEKGKGTIFEISIPKNLEKRKMNKISTS